MTASIREILSIFVTQPDGHSPWRQSIATFTHKVIVKEGTHHYGKQLLVCFGPYKIRTRSAVTRKKEMVPRGRIELPTPAFSGPRSTDELPRHGDNQRFYGKDVEVKRKNARLH